MNLEMIKPTPDTMTTAGICLGASTISIVIVEHPQAGGSEKWDSGNTRVIYSAQHTHDGNPKQALLKAITSLEGRAIDRIAATGRKFRHFVNLTSISEPEAVEYAYRFSRPKGVRCPAVVSAGGETFMVYTLDHKGQISNVITGNKCASGTGEFFLQQLRRMNVTLEEAAQWAATEDPYHVSGRCSVFCKSDCTHATNKGVPKSKVCAGLCQMMANKILELLKKVDHRNIMLTGGTSKNTMMVTYLKKEIPGLIIPEHAAAFEALGAALWAIDNECRPMPDTANLFKAEAGTFDIHPPLAEALNKVEFKQMAPGKLVPGDICILGLDVGSTTTKAVLMRESDNAITAQVYLRTNGDPVGASRKCYQEILNQVQPQVNPDQITIIGLGVCGSGRQIAGLHALTDGVINEIIAHAVAAVYFDPEVDTIFEIGGQDAKYTYITNGVASDYAMNEACSAGTGSFLEESAFESLGIRMEAIADIAIQAKTPPNFNDQCAAFIASDIKNAIHEGVDHEDIVAGLVYSICMNYTNRVKGNRPVGRKVFMQGGVCYNRAVPLAMATLTGKPIIVPPEPGLMGAFGAALEIKKRIAIGMMEKGQFDLETLANREVVYKKPFICKGGKEKCDRRCEISRIQLEGKTYPFGGACNRYYNLRHRIRHDASKLDWVRVRQELIFKKYGVDPDTMPEKNWKARIGLNRSFLVNSYYPLYSNFFSALGFQPVLPDKPSKKGIDQREAPFCFPAELSHGFFHTLIHMDPVPEYLFIPHFKAVPTSDPELNSQVCPIVQGEPYFLRSTFRERLKILEQQRSVLLSPVIDLTTGMEAAKKPLVETAMAMGCSKTQAEAAFDLALARQKACLEEMRELGRKAIEKLETDPDRKAVVLFGRPYNGFAEEAHMGIPHKLASRGIETIPMDFLPIQDEKAKRNMYWGMGQIILKSARFVKRHPQLFGTYITNFSCGPDSFVVGYFRNIMGRKPSLTLELDSHTADAGLETRIEAFLDIVDAYRQLESKLNVAKSKPYTLAHMVPDNGLFKVVTASGKSYALDDPRVTMLIPSMGRLSTEAFAAVCRSYNFNALAHPPADEDILKLGRANTSCKECLPLILTTGMLLNYVGNGRRDDEIVVYFMPTASGPCRFGQYRVFMEDLLNHYGVPDVALFSLSSDNSYEGFETRFHQRSWWAFVIADVMEDIRSLLLANAVDRDQAMTVFFSQWEMILKAIETGSFQTIDAQLARSMESLNAIAMKRPSHEVPVISIIGEIFVRRDHLSRRNLVETLADKGFATICAPIAEWMTFTDWLVTHGYVDGNMNILGKFKFLLKKRYMRKYEKRIKHRLSSDRLFHAEPVEMDQIIRNASAHISPHLTSETIVTVGAALNEVATKTCGAIAIGPFGCMPNRLAESILNGVMTYNTKLATDPDNPRLQSILEGMEDLPFLAIESDGSPFPQVIHAKLESFCLRAQRLHQRMLNAR